MYNEWQSKLPCSSCKIASICKYANVIKRIDYPDEVFNIIIECKIKDKYRTV